MKNIQLITIALTALASVPAMASSNTNAFSDMLEAQYDFGSSFPSDRGSEGAYVDISSMEIDNSGAIQNGRIFVKTYDGATINSEHLDTGYVDISSMELTGEMPAQHSHALFVKTYE